MPGHDLPRVQYLRTIDDADLLRSRLTAGAQKVWVVGAGWIGMEVAAAARGYGARVAVVEADELPLRRVLGDEAAALYRDLHAAHGAEFRFGRPGSPAARRRAGADRGGPDPPRMPGSCLRPPPEPRQRHALTHREPGSASE